MSYHYLIEKLLLKQDLSAEESTVMASYLTSDQLTTVQKTALIMALKTKGESVDEIVAVALAVKALSPEINTNHNLIDVCGTGGDGNNTFNVSTTVAFVVAAAGGYVAKHSGRSISSLSGSADILSLVDIKTDLTTEQKNSMLDNHRICFSTNQQTLKDIQSIRKELGFRTIFNLTGPLTNPFNIKNQVLGVYSKELLAPMANVLKKLGRESAWVVCSNDGLDEISISEPSMVASLNNGEINSFTISPETVGYCFQPLKTIQVSNKQESLRMMQQVFDNIAGPWRDIVCLNAGAALYNAGLADDFNTAVSLAEKVIENGTAKEKFNQAIYFSKEILC